MLNSAAYHWQHGDFRPSPYWKKMKLTYEELIQQMEPNSNGANVWWNGRSNGPRNHEKSCCKLFCKWTLPLLSWVDVRKLMLEKKTNVHKRQSWCLSRPYALQPYGHWNCIYQPLPTHSFSFWSWWCWNRGAFLVMCLIPFQTVGTASLANGCNNGGIRWFAATQKAT